MCFKFSFGRLLIKFWDISSILSPSLKVIDEISTKALSNEIAVATIGNLLTWEFEIFPDEEQPTIFALGKSSTNSKNLFSSFITSVSPNKNTIFTKEYSSFCNSPSFIDHSFSYSKFNNFILIPF